MPRPYSDDLRDRVALSVAAGRSCRETAALFNVSVASVVRWSQRWRETGSAASKPMGGQQPSSLAPHREWILARLAAVPDMTLRGLVRELGDRGIETSYGAVWRLVRGAGLRFKKKPARERTGAGRRGAETPPLEDLSGQT